MIVRVFRLSSFESRYGIHYTNPGRQEKRTREKNRSSNRVRIHVWYYKDMIMVETSVLEKI